MEIQKNLNINNSNDDNDDIDDYIDESLIVDKVY